VLLLAGYNHPVDEVLNELLDCLDHPALPLLQWKEEMSFVESRLPAGAQPSVLPLLPALFQP
jgi:acetyl-CoA carboxylase/biotin carboxylase 1